MTEQDMAASSGRTGPLTVTTWSFTPLPSPTHRDTDNGHASPIGDSWPVRPPDRRPEQHPTHAASWGPDHRSTQARTKRYGVLWSRAAVEQHLVGWSSAVSTSPYVLCIPTSISRLRPCRLAFWIVVTHGRYATATATGYKPWEIDLAGGDMAVGRRSQGRPVAGEVVELLELLQGRPDERLAPPPPFDPRDAWPDYRCNSTPLEPWFAGLDRKTGTQRCEWAFSHSS
ncbi:hypothetical protein BGZ61DRAFT_58103 [Ilyonectria robusta]|uniref:uncharacterized protein n=1 Tax=Ilyonectria robusta TaxID=1079257 RepID=UPI001E8DA0AD|nr:uncharacterized protein BGZ61DRAFT_58103 [Ilyonectria robusta]KAH8685333.1 hypothetical protein BGZ61DRAFT_58103 [Ilyonectria robusta]